jgi:hypothetical protein
MNGGLRRGKLDYIPATAQPVFINCFTFIAAVVYLIHFLRCVDYGLMIELRNDEMGRQWKTFCGLIQTFEV